jgi:hypothetical protein
LETTRIGSANTNENTLMLAEEFDWKNDSMRNIFIDWRFIWWIFLEIER